VAVVTGGTRNLGLAIGRRLPAVAQLGELDVVGHFGAEPPLLLDPFRGGVADAVDGEHVRCARRALHGMHSRELA